MNQVGEIAKGIPITIGVDGLQVISSVEKDKDVEKIKDGG